MGKLVIVKNYYLRVRPLVPENISIFQYYFNRMRNLHQIILQEYGLEVSHLPSQEGSNSLLATALLPPSKGSSLTPASAHLPSQEGSNSLPAIATLPPGEGSNSTTALPPSREGDNPPPKQVNQIIKIGQSGKVSGILTGIGQPRLPRRTALSPEKTIPPPPHPLGPPRIFQ